MEVNLLEEREDGYQAYCVIFDPTEITKIKELQHGDSMETTITAIIEGGLNCE
jgi:hypothetical protein